MNKYISYGEFQNHMRRYYNQSGNKVQFIEMINYLEVNGMLLDERPELVMPYWNSESTTEEFNKVQVFLFALFLYILIIFKRKKLRRL